jgi:hypothetical protein
MIDAASTLTLAPVNEKQESQGHEEVIGPVAPRGSTEGQILTRHKVAGVRGDINFRSGVEVQPLSRY